MEIAKWIISVLAFAVLVDCHKNYDNRDQIYYPGERFQTGNPYQPYPGFPIYGDVNNLQVRGGPPESLRDETLIIKPPSSVLEPPYNDDSGTLGNRFAEVETPNATGSTNSSADDKDIEKASAVLAHFGFNLIKDISLTKVGNTVVSPYSVAILLSLLQQGASGSSLQQISNALQLQPFESAALFQRLGDDIKKRDSQSILEIANNIFISNGFDLNKAFKSIAVKSFRSDVTPLSFSNSVEATKTINDWVAEKTRNKIKDLLSPDTIGENTQLVLLNAMYFKGLWKMKFNVNMTTPKMFNLRSGEKKITPFMRIDRIYKAGYDPKIKADTIILPFENDDYSLMIVKPRGINDMDLTLSALTQFNLQDYHDRFTPQEVKLEIPKFNIKEQVDLIPILKKMGVIDIFSYNSNLGGIGLYRNSAPRVENAVHSAVLSIDEEGGTAAAATAFAAVALINEDIPSYKIDKPFITILWDNKLKVPLFVARVEDPTL